MKPPHPPFLAGHDLPARWQGREVFTLLQTGFGHGHDFLSAWHAWRRNPGRCTRLNVVALEPHPPRRDTLQAIPRDPALADLAARLVDAWPAATPDLHRLAFDGGRVELLLAFGDTAEGLSELEIAVDAFSLDSRTPAGDPWDLRHCRALGRLANGAATLVARTATPAVRDALASAGFVPQNGETPGDITFAVFRPIHRAPLGGRRLPRPPSNERRALIVGGGLAGTAAAWALSERGWRSTLFDRHPRLAGDASGNPGGLFHGTLHADDGVHARFSRAAALAVRPEVERAIAHHGVEGAASGFLRLEPRLTLQAMRTLLDRSGLPPEFVEAVDVGAASALAGMPLCSHAWHYPGGGWVDPAGLARAYAERAGAGLERRLGIAVASIRPVQGQWQLLDALGRPIDEADTLLLANAADAIRLLGDPGWPVERLRGQISAVANDLAPAALRACRLPIASGGYLIPGSGHRLFGATRQRGDDDPAVRRSDHVQNIARLEAMLGEALGIDPDSLGGRTAWRTSAADRLPLVGAVPALDILRDETPLESRWTQARHVPRELGLFMFTALGSRGITISALGAQVVAAAITGTAPPLGARLLDAIDPARFVSRAVRTVASRASAAAPLARPLANQGAGCP